MWQPQRAVLHHSKQTNLHLYRLLNYLADVAAADGTIDPAPNQATLAEFFGVSDRTIRNWINELLDSGELIRTRRGRGSGNASAYQINLPMPELTGSYEEEKPVIVSGNVEERLKSLEEKIAQILPVIEQLQELQETLTGITGSDNRKAPQRSSADDPSLDPSLIQEEEEDAPAHEATNAFWQLPETLKTPEFIVAWQDWLAYTNERQMDFTRMQAKKLLLRLQDWGSARSAAAINHSILKGWKSIYEPDNTALSAYNGHSPPVTPAYSPEVLAAYAIPAD
jgi:hypothetical protein